MKLSEVERAELHSIAETNGHPAADGARDHSHRRLDLEQLIAQADVTPPWRWHEIAADAYLTVLAGQGGDGKSLLTMALAGGVLQGTTVAGVDCKRGRVAIFDAENGPPVIGARLKAAEIPLPGLTVYDADGLDLQGDRDWIAEQLVDVELAIFDSLRSLAPAAKENDSDDMAPILTSLRSTARSTKTAVVLVHHRDKHEHSTYRGSSAIRDQTDMMFVLGRETQDPEARHRRYLRCVKCRIAEEPAERWLRLMSWEGRLTLAMAEAWTAGGAPQRDESASALSGALAGEPAQLAVLARRAGLDPRSGTTRRAMEQLVLEGVADRVHDTYRLACATDAPPSAPMAQGLGDDDAPPRHHLKVARRSAAQAEHGEDEA